MSPQILRLTGRGVAVAVVVRRISISLVVLAVALASAYMGFQLAQGQSVADIGRTIGFESVNHKSGHQVPPACYGTAPGHDTVRENNPNCP